MAAHQPGGEFECPTDVIASERLLGLGHDLIAATEAGDKSLGAFDCRQREEFGFIAVEPASESGMDLAHMVFDQAIVLLGQVAAVKTFRQLHLSDELAQS